MANDAFLRFLVIIAGQVTSHIIRFDLLARLEATGAQTVAIRYTAFVPDQVRMDSIAINVTGNNLVELVWKAAT